MIPPAPVPSKIRDEGPGLVDTGRVVLADQVERAARFAARQRGERIGFAEGDDERRLVKRNRFGPSLRKKVRTEGVADLVLATGPETVELYPINTDCGWFL